MSKATSSLRFRREFEMREPVKSYLLCRGFFPAVEFCLHGCGITDIVAGAYSPRQGRMVPKLLEVVAVELKLSDAAGALRQAKTNRHHCDWSFVAMPAERIEKMRKQTVESFASAGVGLLSVGDDVREILPPSQGSGLAPGRNQVKTLWRRVGRVKQ
jgi:hypothetical protein